MFMEWYVVYDDPSSTHILTVFIINYRECRLLPSIGVK